MHVIGCVHVLQVLHHCLHAYAALRCTSFRLELVDCVGWPVDRFDSIFDQLAKFDLLTGALVLRNVFFFFIELDF